MYSKVEKQRITIVLIISVNVIWREEEEESSGGFTDLIRNLSSLCMSQQSPMAGPDTHRYFLICSCRLTRVGQVQPWRWGLAVGAPLLGEIRRIQHAKDQRGRNSPQVYLCFWKWHSKIEGVDEAVQKQPAAVTTAADSCRVYSTAPYSSHCPLFVFELIPSKQLFILRTRHLPTLCAETAIANWAWMGKC